MPEDFVAPPLEGPIVARATLIPQLHNTELFFVRHGQPVPLMKGASRAVLADPPLSERGRKQADLVGEALAGFPLTAVYCSDLRRACETAAPIAAAHDLEPVIDRELREIEVFRDVPEAVEIADFITRDQGVAMRERFMAERTWDSFPHGEASAPFRERVRGAVDHIAARNGGDRVAIVCHGGVINAYVAHVLGVREDMVFHPAHASVSRIAARGDRRALWTLNELHHLAAAGDDYVTY